MKLKKMNAGSKQQQQQQQQLDRESFGHVSSQPGQQSEPAVNSFFSGQII